MLDASKEVHLEVYTQTHKYMIMYHHKTKSFFKAAYKSFENLTKLKYMGTVVTN